MNTFRTVIMVVAGVAAALSAAPRHALAQAASVSEGARVYGNVCGRCHVARSPLERSDDQWIIIANHMRVRGNLTGEQLRSVLAFLQATNQVPAPVAVPEPGDAQRSAPPSTVPAVIEQGRTLVGEKACLGCHVIAHAGGQVGPTLDGVLRRRGPAFVRQKLSNPTFNNPNSMMPNFQLSQPEIEALVAYLATLQQEAEAGR